MLRFRHSLTIGKANYYWCVSVQIHVPAKSFDLHDTSRFWFKKCFPDIHDRNSFSHKTHWRMVLIGNVLFIINNTGLCEMWYHAKFVQETRKQECLTTETHSALHRGKCNSKERKSGIFVQQTKRTSFTDLVMWTALSQITSSIQI